MISPTRIVLPPEKNRTTLEQTNQDFNEFWVIEGSWGGKIEERGRVSTFRGLGERGKTKVEENIQSF
jgi:hypothetical protein